MDTTKAAAAMQALKMFNGGGASANQGGQSQFIGMAMAQAAKLFDQQSANGNTVRFLPSHSMLSLLPHILSVLTDMTNSPRVRARRVLSSPQPRWR